MPKQVKPQPQPQPTLNWSDISIPQLHNLMKLLKNDGHTIYSVSYLRDAGVDERIIKRFVVTHKSSRTDPKEMIEVDGRLVDAMAGVYGLSVLWSLADYFKVSSNAIGRGFQAQQLTKGIMEHIGLPNRS